MLRRVLLPLTAGLAALALACSSDGDAPRPPTSGPASVDAAVVPATPPSSSGPSEKSATFRETEAPELPQILTYGWETDFLLHSVLYEEIKPFGPGRDGIGPIDDPKFVAVSDPPEYMEDDEPVISLEIKGDSRAYPLAILIKHEIVNDEVGGVPVTVTYCPLCNTGIVFERVLNGRVLDFGTTGNVRHSNLIMWDRQTQSWWQQVGGEAIVGELTGAKLKLIPVQIVSWKDFRAAFPQGLLMSRDTGSGRDYDLPPYGGYDALVSQDLLSSGFNEYGLQPKDRLVSMTVDGVSVAYPFSLLENHPVINDSFEGRDIVIFYVGGTLSPFPEAEDPSAKRGLMTPTDGSEVQVPSEPEDNTFRTIGATAVFSPIVDGRKLTFAERDGNIVDEETGSKWDILGRAVDGPLGGSRLEAVVHGNDFWFSWVAFNPDTAVRTADDLG